MKGEEQAVLDSLLQLLESYSNQDIEGCMAAISTSREILLLGTNENEVLRTAGEVRASFKSDFEHMAHIRWGAPCIAHVTVAEELANVILELPLSYRSNGKDVKTIFRYALMLAKEDGRWKVFSGMASVPYPARSYEL